MSDSKVPWWVLPGLGAMVLSGFFGALIASCFVGNETLQTTMFTAQVTMAAGVVGFYFGSSSGSQKKDDALARAAGQAPEPVISSEKTVTPEKATSTTIITP